MTTAVQQTAASPAQALFASLNAARDKEAVDAKDVSPQDRFLKLLVTQLKNQDPLNPMDNAQMTSQLAQISTVDGIEKLNATLKMILEGSNENQAMQAAAMVGHGVLVPGSGLLLAGGMAIGGVELDGPADRVTRHHQGRQRPGRENPGTGRAAGRRQRLHLGRQDGQRHCGGRRRLHVTVKALRGEDAVVARSAGMGCGVERGAHGDSVSLNVGSLGAVQDVGCQGNSVRRMQ
jgi:flagellar basal-body rod modification protein FlgD